MFLIASSVDGTLREWEQALQGVAVVSRVSDLPALKESMAKLKPEFLLVDFDLPWLGGAEGVQAIQQLSPETRIVALGDSAACDEKTELALVRSGVRGCCCRDINPALLKKVVTAVWQGEMWIRRSLIPCLIEDLGARTLQDRRRRDPAAMERLLQGLTPREQEIAILIGDGANNKQIARRLNISERTVKAHLTLVFRKLEITDRLRLALLVNTNGNEHHPQ